MCHSVLVKIMSSSPYFIKYFKNCNRFDGVRHILYINTVCFIYIRYIKKNKTLRSIPPTSNISHGDDLRSYYVVLNCSNLIPARDINLNLVEFDWNSVETVLKYNKCIVTLPKMYTFTFDYKKNALEDVSEASLGFIHRI